MRFVEFIEYNDNEGEEWRFWLQHDGNEKSLEVLASLVEDSDSYTLKPETVDESEVDILVKHTHSGYFDYENKVTGKLTVPKVDKNDPDDDPLYKGGIKNFFRSVE